MGQEHIVRAGEHMARIADTYGFFNPDTIWLHPRNSCLRQNRRPEVLLPGDVIFIPDKQVKSVKLSTGQAHTFRVQKRVVMLRIALKDEEDRPIGNEPYILLSEDFRYQGKTAASGYLQHEIPVAAESGELILPERKMTWPLRIGHLDPTHDPPAGKFHPLGLRARLNNLCFPVPLQGEKIDEQLAGTLRRFQRVVLKGKEPDGQSDAETLSALEKEHGC